jgi:hypothetical protein
MARPAINTVFCSGQPKDDTAIPSAMGAKVPAIFNLDYYFKMLGIQQML